jgi:hypothetical protein
MSASFTCFSALNVYSQRPFSNAAEVRASLDWAPPAQYRRRDNPLHRFDACGKNLSYDYY